MQASRPPGLRADVRCRPTARLPTIAGVFETFAATFPAHCAVVLGTNYRSTAPIVGASAAVIEQNKRRRPKRLAAAATGPAELVELCCCRTAECELAQLADAIGCLRDSGTPLASIAVLYRTRAVGAAVRTTLHGRGINAKAFHQAGGGGSVGGVVSRSGGSAERVLALLRLTARQRTDQPVTDPGLFKTVADPATCKHTVCPPPAVLAQVLAQAGGGGGGATLQQLAGRPGLSGLRPFVQMLGDLRRKCCGSALGCAADAVTTALNFVKLPPRRPASSSKGGEFVHDYETAELLKVAKAYTATHRREHAAIALGGGGGADPLGAHDLFGDPTAVGRARAAAGGQAVGGGGGSLLVGLLDAVALAAVDDEPIRAAKPLCGKAAGGKTADETDAVALSTVHKAKVRCAPAPPRLFPH